MDVPSVINSFICQKTNVVIVRLLMSQVATFVADRVSTRKDDQTRYFQNEYTVF